MKVQKWEKKTDFRGWENRDKNIEKKGLDEKGHEKVMNLFMLEGSSRWKNNGVTKELLYLSKRD